MSQPITNLVLTVLSPITLNPLTGLYEQRIQVSNGGPATPASVRVLISGLAANATLYNASGTTNGVPYVQSSSPLGVGSNIIFTLGVLRAHAGCAIWPDPDRPSRARW